MGPVHILPVPALTLSSLSAKGVKSNQTRAGAGNLGCCGWLFGDSDAFCTYRLGDEMLKRDTICLLVDV